MNSPNRIRIIAVVGATLALLLGASFVSSWTGPSQTAPNGNVAAPLNVSAADQVKPGGLSLNSLEVIGNMILNGATNYLNFGTTAGTGGYGIRNLSGTLQFKNTGGSWESLETIINNYIDIEGGGSQWTTSGTEIYYNGGNVGVNTTDPTQLLDVRGTMRQTQGTTYDVWLQGGASSAGGDDRNLALLGTDEDSGDLLHLNYNGEYAAGTRIGGNVGIGNFTPVIDLAVGDTDTGFNWVSDGNLALYTNNVERLRFDSSGNVGIGATSPGRPLEINASTAGVRLRNNASLYTDIISYDGSGAGNDPVVDINPVGDATTNALIRLFRTTNTTGSVGLQILRGNNSTSVQTFLAGGTGDSHINASGGNVSIGHLAPAAKLDVYGSILGRGTVTVNEGWSPAQALTLSSNQIYKSVTTGDTSMYLQYSCEGCAVVVGDNSGATNNLIVYGSITGQSFLYSSDSRLKDIKGPISDALSKVDALTGVNFTWNSGPKKGEADIGVIAQDVQSVVPEAVSEGDDGMLRVDYARLVPVLINAIKEQQGQIDSLRAEVEALKQ